MKRAYVTQTGLLAKWKKLFVTFRSVKECSHISQDWCIRIVTVVFFLLLLAWVTQFLPFIPTFIYNTVVSWFRLLLVNFGFPFREPWFNPVVMQCVIHGGQHGTGVYFIPSTSVFFISYFQSVIVFETSVNFQTWRVTKHAFHACLRNSKSMRYKGMNAIYSVRRGTIEMQCSLLKWRQMAVMNAVGRREGSLLFYQLVRFRTGTYIFICCDKNKLSFMAPFEFFMQHIFSD